MCLVHAGAEELDARSVSGDQSLCARAQCLHCDRLDAHCSRLREAVGATSRRCMSKKKGVAVNPTPGECVSGKCVGHRHAYARCVSEIVVLVCHACGVHVSRQLVFPLLSVAGHSPVGNPYFELAVLLFPCCLSFGCL